MTKHQVRRRRWAAPFDGQHTRQLRLQAGLSVETLAALAQVSPNTIRAAESGQRQPRARVINDLAAALGVPPTELTRSPRVSSLHDVRADLGLTQTQIAHLVGTCRQVVSRVERGIGAVRDPQRWATAYRLTVRQWHTARHTARQNLSRPAPRPKGDTP